MKIERLLRDSIIRNLHSGKIVILYGARQTGKTTLAKDVLSGYADKKILEISADEKRFRDILSSQDSVVLKSLIGNADIVFIDEAQRVPDIGLNLKIIHDQIPGVNILVTGSSSFDLANKTKEPLTGRTLTHVLYPLSLQELSGHYTLIDLNSMLENILIYGLYPDIFLQPGTEDKTPRLKELVQSYVYKDVLEFSGVKNTSKVEDLLRLLAYQTGSEASMPEIGERLGMSKDTVEKYISILENAFIVFRLSGYSRNLRNEITKMDKIYFYDTGLRNVLIGDLNPLRLRNDAGRLWENFLIAERKKYIEYNRLHARGYFWRTYTRVEIDYIEESEGRINAYELKFSPRKKKKAPSTWVNAYPDSVFTTITKDNFWDFAGVRY